MDRPLEAKKIEPTWKFLFLKTVRAAGESKVFTHVTAHTVGTACFHSPHVIERPHLLTAQENASKNRTTCKTLSIMAALSALPLFLHSHIHSCRTHLGIRAVALLPFSVCSAYWSMLSTPWPGPSTMASAKIPFS